MRTYMAREHLITLAGDNCGGARGAGMYLLDPSAETLEVLTEKYGQITAECGNTSPARRDQLSENASGVLAN